jgi:hypothetical protein
MISHPGAMQRIDMMYTPQAEPFVGLAMNFSVVITQLPWSNALLQSLRLRGGAILICTAHVECSPITGSIVTVHK